MASPIIIPPKEWPEAEVVLEPFRGEGPEGPTVLVRRRRAAILGPRGEDLLYFAGPTAISLFTGAGGFDLGIEAAGFVTLCQHERDGACCETLIANRPRCFRHAALIQGDLRATPTSMILREAGLYAGETHLVVGGPPCQGFSASGKRREDDVRNTLVAEYVRVVREAQPRFFIMENVPGFTSLAGGRFLREFLASAHAAYYELVYGIANAVEHGVPQNRNRFFCMGTRRDLFEIDGTLGSLPRPQNFGPGDLEYLRRIEGSTLFGPDFDGRAAMLTHPPGIRYFPDRPVLVPPAPCQGGGRSDAFIEFYRRLLKEEPDRIVAAPTAA